MKTIQLGMSVGILGGGQLARMLAESAIRLGLRPVVLAGSAADPAAALCPGAIFGTWHDEITLRRLFSQVELTVFENEFVPCEFLDEAGRQVYARTKERFWPSLQAIFELQDKLSQKRALEKLGIPCARYVAHDGELPLGKWLEQVAGEFGNAFVLKWARQGYDGHGTWIAPRAGMGASERKDALAFCETARKRGLPLFAEERVDFKQELAIVATYSRTGELAPYPLVISEQDRGICRRVRGPATALGVSAALEKQAHDAARKVATHLKLFGTFGIEFFETQDGRLLVNEMAPRVHNTGHYSQDACRTSQFENHWRGVLGLPLGRVDAAPAFAMLNLLGPEGVQLDPGVSVPAPRPRERTHLHWYGKQELRPRRKLGHLNGVARDPSELPQLLSELDTIEREWADELRSLKGEGARHA